MSMKTNDASALISEKIASLDDWRGETLARMRKLIQQADPNVVEEWKWDISAGKAKPAKKATS